MPATKLASAKRNGGTKARRPLYQRGKYRLFPRADRGSIEIVWWDNELGRERHVSAGTSDISEAVAKLDRLYLEAEGVPCCPHCRRPWDGIRPPTVIDAIGDYLLKLKGRPGYPSAFCRLAHVIEYCSEHDPEITCDAIDQAWIGDFREWLLERPKVSKNGKPLGQRHLAGVEGSVLQLAAAINSTPGQTAKFKADQQVALSQSPVYRADIDTLAAMFGYCLAVNERRPDKRAQRLAERANLLRYLRFAVATWARPDAIFECKRDQWHSDAGVLDLNQPNRRQTKKYRPKIPIAKQFRPLLDSGEAFLPVSLVRAPWAAMRTALKLPDGRGDAAEKLIRRSVATLARKIIGEGQWRQGEIMLGHVKSSISDIYALPDPVHLGRALEATETIIAEIEARVPGAYLPQTSPTSLQLRIVAGGKN